MWNLNWSLGLDCWKLDRIFDGTFLGVLLMILQIFPIFYNFFSRTFYHVFLKFNRFPPVFNFYSTQLQISKKPTTFHQLPIPSFLKNQKNRLFSNKKAKKPHHDFHFNFFQKKLSLGFSRFSSDFSFRYFRYTYFSAQKKEKEIYVYFSHIISHPDIMKIVYIRLFDISFYFIISANIRVEWILKLNIPNEYGMEFR